MFRVKRTHIGLEGKGPHGLASVEAALFRSSAPQFLHPVSVYCEYPERTKCKSLPGHVYISALATALSMESCTTQIAMQRALAYRVPHPAFPGILQPKQPRSCSRGQTMIVYGDKNKDLGKRVAKAQEVWIREQSPTSLRFSGWSSREGCRHYRLSPPRLQR